MALSVVVSTSSMAQDVHSIKVRKPSAHDQYGERFLVDAVSLFVSKVNQQEKRYKVEQIDITDRQLMNFESYLERGFFDVNYFGTSERLEKTFLPVRIPLFAGLLGYRLSIVKGKNLALFANASLERLKSLPVCQGSIWADSDILEHNGFSVLRVSHYEFIIRMLDAERCHYFPRGIFEGAFELAILQKNYPDFRLVDNLVIYYPFPAYLFVRKDQQQLAGDLKRGFEAAIADGSYRALLQQHPLTRNVFPLDKWRDRRFIHLDNPNLPKATPIDNADYWLKLDP
ncbi:hypothetical protein [Catenovulum agarivorans]|nr:hypothetical protein [Catenovulum agarivorans]